MSQLNAKASSSKNPKLCLYFSLPKTTYEKFVNKKWCERKDIYESKQTFIKRTLSEWKVLNKDEKVEFLSSPAPENRHSIKIFFSVVQKPSSKHMPQPTPKEPLKLNPPILTGNAHSALSGREKFLQSKELVLIKEFLAEIGFKQDFDDSSFKDPQFLQALSKLSYDWKVFSNLKRKYMAGGYIQNNQS